MACLVTKGRAINCNDVQGGISALFITNGVAPYGTVTISSDAISNMSGTFTAFKYDLNGAGNSFTTTATTSKDTGTTFYSTVLSVTLPKLSKDDSAQLKLLSYGRNSIVVQDRNLNAFLLGRENGVTVSSTTMTSGDGRGDMSGYTIEFLAEEASPPDFINGATAATPFAGMSSASPTITVGTNS
jgi:hypothetical protein|tara:strand:- start:730 stop:1284 length:555 start_codon:yes stop_codon:yes gene_type:complete